jgi:hypothetical protein
LLLHGEFAEENVNFAIKCDNKNTWVIEGSGLSIQITNCACAVILQAFSSGKKMYHVADSQHRVLKELQLL